MSIEREREQMVSIIDHAVPSDMDAPTNYLYDREVKATNGYHTDRSNHTERTGNPRLSQDGLPDQPIGITSPHQLEESISNILIHEGSDGKSKHTLINQRSVESLKPDS